MKKRTQAQTDTLAEHATAQWVVHHFPPGQILIRDAQYGHNIATVAVLGVAMAEANARLIAAAPDMLVALHAILDDLEAGLNISLIAKTAIAKAEGRSPAR